MIIVCSEEVRVRCAPGVVVIRQLCSLIRISIDLCFFYQHHINLFFLGVVVVVVVVISLSYYSWVNNHHRQLIIFNNNNFVVPSGDKSNLLNIQYRQMVQFYNFFVSFKKLCLDVCDGHLSI